MYAGVFVAYAVVTFGFLCFFYKYLPETKNLPLEEITYAFHDDNWGKRVFFSGNRPNRQSNSGGYGNDDNGSILCSSDSDDFVDFNSNIESSEVSEALLKTKYFEDSSGSSSRRRHSTPSNSRGLSGDLSGEMSGLLAGEVSYSTQNDGHDRHQ